jgi:predicted dehydrogenase
MAFKLGVIGIDHGHIFGMLGQMKAQGCTCDAYWTDGPAVTEAKFNETFPEVAKVDDRRRILDDPAIRMILISAVPADRAALAIEAMEAGKDVMVDKPGCTTLEQLAAVRECQARTGRIWSVNFSERFEVPAVTKAEELVFGGAIGRVVQTVGLGPHKQNLRTRPAWYFEQGALRRHPDRHRLAPDRPVPALHGVGDGRDHARPCREHDDARPPGLSRTSARWC